MKVGLISTPWETVPPKGYGGIESMIYDLICGFQEKDLSFSLFSVGETARHPDIETFKMPVGFYFDRGQYPEICNPEKKIWIELVHDLSAWRWMENQEVDLIHVHSGAGSQAIAWAKDNRPPVLITLHGPLDAPLVQSFYNLLAEGKRIYFNSISNDQRRGMPRLNYIDTVYHGITVEHYPFIEQKREYFLIIGRITSIKGQREAIDVARALGKNLIIAGDIENTADGINYWQKEIAPQIDEYVDRDRNKLYSLWRILDGSENRIIYFGGADFSQKTELFGSASATLMPISWEEPFGLVMIESLACGTPVIGFHRGSVPEIVEHGKTGFVANDLDQMIEAAKKAGEILPLTCRRSAEERFSHRVMAKSYLGVYQKIIEQT